MQRILCAALGVVVAAALAAPVVAARLAEAAPVAHCPTPRTQALVQPSLVEIGLRMSGTIEVAYPSTHFTPWSDPLTIADGRGGTLTAIVGVRYPTADAKGQLVFFWHGRQFLGWDSRYESNAIVGLSSPAPGVFAVRFAHYAPTDALCCPSLRPVQILYRWTGSRIQASGTPPLTSAKVRMGF